MHADPKLIEAAILACLEDKPVDFRNADDTDVRRARAAIRRATRPGGAAFRDPVRRLDFLGGCLAFTEQLPEEHLIVGYGLHSGRTTYVERLHHVVGEQRKVSVPGYVQQEIRRHHFHRSDAEVIVFHNHPRTGDEPAWFYTLKSLLEDLPIASNDDRQQLQHHAFNAVGLFRQLFGQGRVLFYIGESGYVKPFQLPPLLPWLNRLNSRG